MNQSAISLHRVSFAYRGAPEPALRDVTLEVRAGEFVVVMGATGAGKTTLAKCLNRTVPSFEAGRLEGDIAIAGRSLRDETVADLAGVVGLVTQDFEAQLFATNATQELAFGLEQLGVAPAEIERRLAAAFELVGLRGFERRDPSTLSGGEKQRLAIAAVLALEPAVLVFDEPTTDLDPQGKIEVFEVLARLRAGGATILLIEHEIAAAERADRLVLMSDGRIVADERPERLLVEVEWLERLGVRAADLDRLGRALGYTQRFGSVDAAAEVVRPRLRGRVARQPENGTAHGAPLLEVDRISYAYDGEQPALVDVSLAIHSGEFVAFIGQNGSGKTTLAKHLNGLLHPAHGQVRLAGADIRTLPLNRVARDVGYVFQNPDHQIFAATVRDEVAFGLVNFGVDRAAIAARAARALEDVGLAGLEEADPFLLGKGQRQQLAVASLLALQPRLLILDEPTTGLDYREQRRMMELLRCLHQQGLTLVVITHSPWVVAEYAKRAVLMQGGRVRFDGPLRALFAEEALLRECHFRPPDVTLVGRRCGFTPRTLEELVAAAGAEGG
jgi:energy-coupling factor transport system ATP-binding protein